MENLEYLLITDPNEIEKEELYKLAEKIKSNMNGIFVLINKSKNERVKKLGMETLSQLENYYIGLGFYFEFNFLKKNNLFKSIERVAYNPERISDRFFSIQTPRLSNYNLIYIPEDKLDKFKFSLSQSIYQNDTGNIKTINDEKSFVGVIIRDNFPSNLVIRSKSSKDHYAGYEKYTYKCGFDFDSEIGKYIFDRNQLDTVILKYKEHDPSISRRFKYLEKVSMNNPTEFFDTMYEYHPV